MLTWDHRGNNPYGSNGIDVCDMWRSAPFVIGGVTYFMQFATCSSVFGCYSHLTLLKNTNPQTFCLLTGAEIDSCDPLYIIFHYTPTPTCNIGNVDVTIVE